MVKRLPCVLVVALVLPLHKVLCLQSFSAMIEDLLDLLLFFIFVLELCGLVELCLW